MTSVCLKQFSREGAKQFLNCFFAALRERLLSFITRAETTHIFSNWSGFVFNAEFRLRAIPPERTAAKARACLLKFFAYHSR